MLVQSLGYPAQEALRSGLSHSAPNTCTAISFETPRNGAANPCPGDICQHIPLTPTETFSLSLFLLFYYLRALPSLPCQPKLGVVISLISLLPASQLAALSLLLSCSSCPSTPVPETGAEAFALQSSATGSAHISCSLLSCLCCSVHLCSREIFSCSPPQSVIPTSFPSPSVCLHPHRSASCLLQTESPYLPQIK